MSSAVTLQQVVTRLTAVDGVGAPVPSQADIPVINSDLNALHQTINQLTLVVQGELNKLAQQVQQVQTGLAGATIFRGNISPTSFQTARVSYTLTTNDFTNLYVDLPIAFAAAFADANYTVETTLELVTASIPVWQPSHVYAAGAAIIDSNGGLQITTAGGTSGAGPNHPVWSTVESGITTDGGITDWALQGASLFLSSVKARTNAGFTQEFDIDFDPTPTIPISVVLHVTAWHD